jgi:hypothetical protein
MSNSDLIHAYLGGNIVTDPEQLTCTASLIKEMSGQSLVGHNWFYTVQLHIL